MNDSTIRLSADTCYDGNGISGENDALRFADCKERQMSLK